MSDVLKALQRRHRDKLAQLERDGAGDRLLDEVHIFITDLQRAGTLVADPAERVQLRALMRFWGNVVYQHTGTYPDMSLHPLDPNRAPSPEGEERRPLPPLIWLLVGGAAAVAIAAGLVAIGWLTRPEEVPEPTLVPFVDHVAVGRAIDPDGTLEGATDVFCFGTSQIVAEFGLQDVGPEMTWRWEVRRGDTMVAGQPAVPWGTEPLPGGVRILSGEAGGVPPGQYDLLIYVSDRVVGVHSFEVLDVPPRILNLRLSDVPDPAGAGGDETILQENARTVYLSYDYQGFCPGVDVVHALHYGDEPIQKIASGWSGVDRGQGQATFQAADSSFPSGRYRVDVTVGGGQQASLEFSVGEVKAAPPPSFGQPIIALGVQSDGTPVLTTPANVFDWNTKVIYAIFSYEGIVDGTKWSAVWARNGQVVARQERLWDETADGTAGTRWVVHHGEGGIPLPGGTYSVTLTLDGATERTGDFQILYYVPPEEGEEDEEGGPAGRSVQPGLW